MKALFLHLSTTLLLIAGMQSALAQVEIVIDVSDAEAQAVIQAFEDEELRYAELSWQSSGRIRLAKINADALKQSRNQIQFTPFPDVAPIVMTSYGVGGDYGYTWTGERVYDRVDGLLDRQTLEAAIAATPEIIALGTMTADLIMADVVKEFETVNTVTLSIGSVLMDADTREFLADPNALDAENYLFNPATGATMPIDGLESSFKWLVEKAGIEYPCEKRAIPKTAGRLGAMTGMINPPPPPPPRRLPTDELYADDAGIVTPAHAFQALVDNPTEFAAVFGVGPSSGTFIEMTPSGQPEFIDRGTGHVTNSQHGYVFVKKSGGRGVTVPCKPPGDVLDRLANLPDPYRDWSSAKNYERIKPLPASARYFESVGGSIRDKSITPFPTTEEHNAVGAKTYRIDRLHRHPEYVVIYELDASRRPEPMMIDDHRSQAEIDAWARSPQMVAYRKSEKYRRIQENIASKKAHMDAARTRISARGQPRGHNK